MPDNKDKIDSIASPVKGDTMKSIIDHIGADTDSSTLAIHHTLGPKPFQASPGSHIHDGKDSKKIKLSNVILDVEISATNGIPAGGTDGQVLTKQGSTNYVAAWEDPGAAAYTNVVKHLVKAGTAVTKGQAVYVSSADGTNMIVSKASNASEATSSKTMGLMADTLALNGHGYVVTEGLLAGLDTSTAAAGDVVWLGTDGNLIYGLTNKPVAPAHLVFIGIVTRSNANNGEIFIAPQNGFELQELHNVLITSLADNHVLAYDSASSLWKNQTASDAGLAAASHTHDDRYYTETETDTLLNGKSNTGHTHDDRYYTETETDTLLNGKSNTGHSHAIADTTGLQSALDSKALNSGYTANKVVVTSGAGDLTVSPTIDTTELGYLNGVTSNIQTQLGNKSDTGHTHDDRYYTETETDTLLNGKSNTGHTHDDRYYTETETNTLLNGKSDTGHSHAIADTTGLQTALDNKAATDGYTADRVLISNSLGAIAPSSTISTTELGYLNGVTSNIQTQLDTAVKVDATDIPNAADLNTYTTSGVYVQGSNAEAAAGSNYPIGYAGVLEVYSRTSTLIWQRYTTYQPYNKVYHRGFYSTTWSAWKEVVDFTSGTRLDAGDIYSNGSKVLTAAASSGVESLSIDSGVDISAGIPGTTANGAINIEDHLKFFVNTDAATYPVGAPVYGDYDADIWMKDNGYIMAENSIHLRPTSDGSMGSYTEQGRLVLKSDVLTSSGAINWIQSGRNYSGTTKNDLAISEYSQDGSLDHNYWAYFDQSNSGNLGLGFSGSAATAPDINYKLHVKNNVGTTTPIMRVENTGSAYSLLDFKGSTTSTAVNLGANANALVARIGTSDVLSVASGGITVNGSISGNVQAGGANFVCVSDANGYLSTSATVDTTELGYLNGATSNIQTQLNGKAASSHTHAIADVTGLQTALDGKVATNGFTASRVLVSDATGALAVSSTIDTAELGYLNGVTSNIQTQLDAKTGLELYRFETADNLIMSGVGSATTASVFGTNGVAVEAGTAYLVEGVIYFTAGVVGTSATHSISWGSPSGAATVTRNTWLWNYNSSTTVLANAAAMSGVRRAGTTTFAALNTITMTGTHLFRGKFYGVVEFNAAGNFTPRITVTPTSASVDLTINAGSYIKLKKLGTTNTNGTWS